MKATSSVPVSTSEMVKACLGFWFGDRGHLRSPFPSHLRAEVSEAAVARFQQWLQHLPEKAKDEVNDEIVAERLEEMLFEAALPLARSEEERLTLLFPFLPREGDVVEDVGGEGESTVASRRLVKEGDTHYLGLELKSSDGRHWQTRLQLPA